MQKINKLENVADNNHLFIIDAVAMYPNINTKERITALLVSFYIYFLTRNKDLLVR